MRGGGSPWLRRRPAVAGSAADGPRGVARAALPPGDCLRLGNAEVFVEDDVDAADPVLVLRAAATAARHGAVIERRSLERLAAAPRPGSEPWDDEARAS